MEQMVMEKRKVRSNWSEWIARVLVISLVLLGLTSLIISAVILWHVTRIYKNTDMLSQSGEIVGAGVLDRFPGFFRTDDEQMLLERRMVEQANLGTSQNTSPPHHKTLWTLYNACCSSNSTYWKPTYLEDINGINRTIVQLSGHFQFVLQDTCTAVDGCGGRTCNCVCKKLNFLTTLVYYTNKAKVQMAFGQFNAGEVCKCINTAN